MWETVEAEAGKTRVAKTKRRRSKEGSRQEKRGKGRKTKEKTKKGKTGRNQKANKGVGDLGRGRRGSKVGGRCEEVGSREVP